MEDKSEKYLNIYKKRHIIIVDNFLGGIFWGMGSIIGIAILLSLLGWFITYTRDIPFMGKITQVFLNNVEEGKKLRDELNK